MGYQPRMDDMIIIHCMGWIATAMHVFKRIHIARNEVHVRWQAWSFAQNRTSGFISEPKKHIPMCFLMAHLLINAIGSQYYYYFSDLWIRNVMQYKLQLLFCVVFLMYLMTLIICADPKKK
eukprot:565172_1